jgi:hypothetical protein
VENDVIEVGEVEDIQILSAPKKKTLGTRQIAAPKNGSSKKSYNNEN